MLASLNRRKKLNEFPTSSIWGSPYLSKQISVEVYNLSFFENIFNYIHFLNSSYRIICFCEYTFTFPENIWWLLQDPVNCLPWSKSSPRSLKRILTHFVDAWDHMKCITEILTSSQNKLQVTVSRARKCWGNPSAVFVKTQWLMEVALVNPVEFPLQWIREITWFFPVLALFTYWQKYLIVHVIICMYETC